MRLKSFTSRLTCLFLFFLLPPLVLTEPTSGQTDRPNVIWLIAEDLSPDLGCYGNASIDTPHLDRLAKNGMRFTRAYATAPTCAPSRSAFNTGMYQTTIGAHHQRLPDRLNKTQQLIMKPRGPEELYNLGKDPWQVNNLVNTPEHQQKLQELRKSTRHWIKRSNDQGQFADPLPVVKYFYEYGKKSARKRKKQILRLRKKVHRRDKQFLESTKREK